MFALADVRTQMSRTAAAIRHLCSGVDAEQARWRPPTGDWSMLEVVNHLYDEEREDFRARLRSTLEQPDAPWAPIDPQGWVTARAYNERELAPSLNNFLDERRRSLAWLDGLTEPRWENVHEVAGFPPITAGDLLASWLAHDLLHLRQLVELHYAYAAQAVRPYSPAYAGDW